MVTNKEILENQEEILRQFKDIKNEVDEIKLKLLDID